MNAYQALHPRQSPNLGKALADAQASKTPLIGLFSGLDSVATTKIAAGAGLDVILTDAEHTSFNAHDIVEHVQIVNHHSQGKTLGAVRIPHLDSELIGYALDAGSGGIMLPHTETAEQARGLVAACLFSPQGHRSAPPLAYIFPDHLAAPEGKNIFEVQNEHGESISEVRALKARQASELTRADLRLFAVAPIVQIESAKGIENAEEIISTPGVKGCMIGIGDLFIDLGFASRIFSGKPMLSEENLTYYEGVKKVAALCEKYKVPLIIPAFPQDVEETRKLNPGLLFIGVDGSIYAHALLGAVGAAKAGREACALKNTNGKAHPEQ